MEKMTGSRGQDVAASGFFLPPARALRWREDFQACYDQDPSYAPDYLRRWCYGAKHCRLQPIKHFVTLVDKHWDGITAWHKTI